MQKESFLLGVSLTCLIVMLVGPKVLSVSHDTCESGQDTLKVEVVKPMPNFQLEAHQIHSSLNKSKLKQKWWGRKILGKYRKSSKRIFQPG